MATDNGGLVLVGYRGTGKTTVGRLVADRLGLPFFDSDQLCESVAGQTVAEIFAQGESAFRDLEAQAILDLTDRHSPAILSTGGGAILRDATRRRLREYGLVVWLAAPPMILAERLAASPTTRPALTALGTLGEISQVLAAREPLYREIADYEVDTSTIRLTEVVDRVISCFRAGAKR